MSGPSIRSWEFARVLASRHRVTLAAPGEPQRTSDAFEVHSYDADTLPGLVATHEIVQMAGPLLEQFPVLGRARHLVVDLYDPYPLEGLHLYDPRYPEVAYRTAARDREVLTRLIQAGDVFLCASERQRDFWTGWLTAAGRVNPYVHKQDPALRNLLRLVPFGVPEEAPQSGPPRFRGVVPGIANHDFVVLWGGGIWNWFDPLTLIRAAALLRFRLPKLRVVFPALSSPSPAVPAMAMSAEAQRLSAELGLTDKVVFFGQGWVPYEERGAMLLEADVGASLHVEGVETRYSFRTRVLDYLWGGLPILATEGDPLGDLIRSEELGAVVPYGDVQAVADALYRMARKGRWRRGCARRCREAAARFHWSEVARPLLDYCAAPLNAPDRGQPMPLLSWPHPDPTPPEPPEEAAPPPDPEPAPPVDEPYHLPDIEPDPPGNLLARVANAYRVGGFPLIAEKSADRLRRTRS
jgi:glycosyltransferase involved in cell wall biosynthesis